MHIKALMRNFLLPSLVLGRKFWQTANRVRINFQRKLHYRYPNFIPSDDKAEEAYCIKRDFNDNFETRIPKDEEVRLSCFWAAELFGPSEIQDLYAGFERLGWTNGTVLNRNPVDWVKNQRMYGPGGGWYNVGTIHREGDLRHFMNGHIANYPKEFDYLTVKIYQLTSSLTCVSVCFILTDEAAKCYEREINEDRKTTRSRVSGQRGYSEYSVDHVKMHALAKQRAYHKSLVETWFLRNIPGFFCRSTDGNRLPTAELLTVKYSSLFPGKNDSEISKTWLRLFFARLDFYVWANEKFPGLAFIEEPQNGKCGQHLVAAIKTSSITDEDLKHLGDRTHAAVRHFCNERLEGVIANYAAIALLNEIRRNLSVFREGIRTSKIRRNEVVNTLGKLEAFFGQNMGVPAITSELFKKAKEKLHFSHGCDNFVAYEPYRNQVEKEEIKIAESLQWRTSKLAEKAIDDESMTRQLFEQFSNILSTRESIKSQNKMEILTWFTIILAVSSIIISIVALKN